MPLNILNGADSPTPKTTTVTDGENAPQVIEVESGDPIIIHVIEPAVVGTPPEYQGLADEIAELDERADVVDTALTENRTLINQHTSALIDGRQALLDHIGSAAPHPAYDDMPSLKLLFENGLI